MAAFYDDPESAESYIRMARGHDGAALIAELGTVLAEGATVLELGMGPGVDLDLLATRYRATGSDASGYFVERYRKRHPDADLMLLDATSLPTGRRFEAIYSNKVLHHLSDADLARSIDRQRQVLEPAGWVLHSFWAGEHSETVQGLVFHYRRPDAVAALFGAGWTDIRTALYQEFSAGDSFSIMARRAELADAG